METQEGEFSYQQKTARAAVLLSVALSFQLQAANALADKDKTGDLAAAAIARLAERTDALRKKLAVWVPEPTSVAAETEEPKEPTVYIYRISWEAQIMFDVKSTNPKLTEAEWRAAALKEMGDSYLHAGIDFDAMPGGVVYPSQELEDIGLTDVSTVEEDEGEG
jgi:hypothetical protein